MPGLFVTATDTGVGKTVVACALLARLPGATAFKPVITGLDEPGPHDHELLAAMAGQSRDEVAPERFGPAVSPHLAAEQAGRELPVAALVARACALAEKGTVVIEGAGGLLAPLTAATSMADLARSCALPLVVVARPGLGTLNHTRLTLHAARWAGLDVRAVVLTPWPEQPSAIEVSNLSTLRDERVDVVTLGAVDARDRDALARAAAGWDVEGWLAPARPAVAVDHVVVAVSDWERSNRFYAEVCRAELVRLDSPPPTRWRYRFAGDVQLNVHGPGMDPLPVPRIPTEPGMADLCLVWPGTADEAAAHVRGCGVAVEEGPVWRNGTRGPGRSVYFRDPDGSLLEFIAYG